MTTTEDASDPDRLTQVETLLSHLQHDVDKLNEALIAQQSQIDDLQQKIVKLTSIVEALPEEPRDPAEERPPHY